MEEQGQGWSVIAGRVRVLYQVELEWHSRVRVRES
jgi:hypothetical protein